MTGQRPDRRAMAVRSAGMVVVALLLAGCAAGANPEAATPAADGTIAGFWLGLWHGLIAPVTFVVSLFSDSVGIYEVHNNGGWYDAGFVLGLGFIVGGSSTGAQSASSRERGPRG
jgi:hypothetical protein